MSLYNSYPTLGSYGFGQLGVNTLYQPTYTLSQALMQQPSTTLNSGGLYQTLMGKPWDNNIGILPQLSDTFGMLGNTLGSIFGVWNAWQGIELANKQMDLFDNQLQITKEQWLNTKKELDYMRKARKAFADSYLGK